MSHFQFIKVVNPYEPLRDMERGEVKCGCTIEEMFKAYFGESFDYFETPHLVQLNGTPVFKQFNESFPDAPTWQTQPKPGDVVSLCPIPGDIVTAIVYIVVAIVVSVAVTLALSDPSIPNDTSTQGDTVYNLKGQQNQVRLSDPVECHYGKVRIFPSYAAAPFNQYEGNNQYQYSLFCVGLGVFDIDSVYIEDTPITNFDEVTYELIEPGGVSTIFPDNVTSSVEVSNVELYGPNQEEYPDPDGWFGGFVVNPSGTEINKIEVDIALPQGLFTLYEGARYNRGVVVEFQAREVDDDGNPVGGAIWETIIDETITRRTQTPQRLTFSAEVDSGRYEVRGRRTSDKSNSAQVSDLCQWEALRSFEPSSLVYPKTTMLAVKALASNNLNNNTRSRVNVYATRKLPIWNDVSQEWSEPATTRNPVWAFCDALRSDYGGRLDTEYLDMPSLYSLSQIFEAREDYFDGTFDSPTTIWESLKAISRVGRAAPISQGSRITMIRDQAQSLPAAMFNQENMIEGSFEENLKIFEFGEFDSLLVEYMDPVSFKPVEVLCQLPELTADNPDTLKLFGCTSRDQAYREGMYILACRQYQRINYKFKTGLEGHIPTFLDSVAISHDVFEDGRSGFVVAYDEEERELTLSESVIFEDEKTYAVIFRGNDGAAMGAAIEVSEGNAENKIILASEPPDAFNFSTLNQVPPLYFFGEVGSETVKGKVVGISPDSQDEVSIELVNYDERVYGFDEYPTPSETPSTGVKNVDLPEVENVIVTTIPDKSDLIVISWNPSFGALQYVIQRTFDTPVSLSSSWEPVATVSGNQTTLEVPVLTSDVVYRVAAIRNSRGGWAQSPVATVGVSGTVPASPILNSTQPDFDELTASVIWQTSAGANGYSVDVYKQGEESPLRQVDVFQSLQYDYTISEMEEDSVTPSRELEFRVKAYNGAGASDPETVHQVTNDAPFAPTTPAAVDAGGGDYDFSWDAVAGPPADFDEYRVYMSETPGFTPAPSNLVYQGADSFCTLAVPATRYWRVAAFDKWAADDEDANFTAEQTISI